LLDLEGGRQSKARAYGKPARRAHAAPSISGAPPSQTARPLSMRAETASDGSACQSGVGVVGTIENRITDAHRE